MQYCVVCNTAVQGEVPLCPTHQKLGVFGGLAVLVFGAIAFANRDKLKSALAEGAEETRNFVFQLLEMSRVEAREFLEFRIPKMSGFSWGWFHSIVSGISDENPRAALLLKDACEVRRQYFPNDPLAG